MNAIDPATPDLHTDQARPIDPQPVRLLRGLSLAGAAVAAILLAASLPAVPALAPLRQGGTIPVLIASLLLAIAGLAGAWLMAWARRRANAPRTTPPMRRWRRMLAGPASGDPALIGRTARWPQAILIVAITAWAIACAWLLPSAPAVPPAPPATDFLFGGLLLALAFPLLIVERLIAAMPPARFPEAPSLHALLLLPVIAWPAAGLVRIVTGLGVPFAERLDTPILLLLTAVAAELCLRALGRCFLPPPAPSEARAAIDSLLVRMIADGVSTRSLAAPVCQHLGIDFARSWALSYLRAAIVPVSVFLLLLCWGLSGVVLVGLDQRAVYERFGAPVAVLHPGLHVILPWPMGQVRRVEFGTIHDTTLTDTALPSQRVGAEDKAPPDADRLWEQAHPAELMFLIASETGTKQSFQVVSADIKLRYQIGLTDTDALHAAYRVADPAALLRAAAGRVTARFFASRTLDQVLGKNRESMAGRLRTSLQQQMDEAGCGLRLESVVIEAIHPPAGAAEAYHNVQAAQIQAVTSIAAEQGSAIATRAKARQYGTDITTQAQAAAAETVGTATADLTRFTADHAASAQGGDSFVLERRLSAIASSLPKASVIIIDHRIPDTEAPTVDLRPFSPPAALSAGHDQE
jgi:regulator of protease activity HflC (stomatin/prohibitin superfamily)